MTSCVMKTMPDHLADHLVEAQQELPRPHQLCPPLLKQPLLRALAPDHPLAVGPRRMHLIGHQLPLLRRPRRRRPAAQRPIASRSQVHFARHLPGVALRCNRGLGAATAQLVAIARRIANARRAGSAQQAVNAQQA